MKPLIFYRHVVNMRKWQKLYDRNRSFSALAEARKIERIIDAEIGRVEKIVMQREQQGELNLFDDNGRKVSEKS